LTNVISYKYIWNLTFPVILSLVAQNLTNLIDTIFLGHVGEVELGASAIGGLLYFTFFIIGFGFSIGAQILISRRNGEKKYKEIGVIFEKTIICLMVIAVCIIIITTLLSPIVMKKYISSPKIFEATYQFLDYRIWGIFFAFINTAFRAFYIGVLKPKYLTYSAIIIALINIILDYFLIFGNGGFPKLGISGAAIASVIAEFSSVTFFIIISLNKKNITEYGLYKINRKVKGVISSILKLSVYVMIQSFISLSAWFIFFIIIERTGQHNLAISNILRSVYIFLLIPCWAYSTTINTLVSNLMGRGKMLDINLAIRKTIISCCVVTTIVLIPFIVFTQQVATLFTTDNLIILDSISPLRVIFSAMILAGISWNLFNVITGSGNTRASMIIEIITILFYLTYVYILAIYAKSSLTVVWTSEFIYFIVIGTLSALYLKFANWKKKAI